MKLYKTKNRLIFTGTVTLFRLGQLCDKHREKYGKSPNLIFMTDEDWERYEEILGGPRVKHYKGLPKITRRKTLLQGKAGVVCLIYRGIPVVRIDDWRRLSRK